VIDGPALALFALLGLFGALHCAGMCGPFALGVALSARGSRRRAILRSVLYLTGKALSYAVLGLAAAQITGFTARAGAELTAGRGSAAGALELARRGLAWIAGLSIVFFALRAFGWSFPWSGRAARFVPRWSGALFGSARALSGAPASFATGLASGLLPCGLSWSALAMAASCEPATAALGMFVFGLATAPALAAVAACGALAAPEWRARAARLAAPALLAFGVFTLARGGLPPVMQAADPRPECCRDAADAGVEHGAGR
jgi:sulfite exporter TauE/SafE